MAEVKKKPEVEKPEVEKPMAAPAGKYVCTVKCYFNDRLWNEGDETAFIAGLPLEYFQKV